MPTPTGKPQKGERIEFKMVLLGQLEAHFVGTVLEWPRYGRVKVRVDEVVSSRTGGVDVGRVWQADEYAAAMWLRNGTVKVIESDPLTWTACAKPAHVGRYVGWQAELADGRTAKIEVGLGHRLVLSVDGERVGTFSSRRSAERKAEKINESAAA